jgi:hypothetical protein
MAEIRVDLIGKFVTRAAASGAGRVTALDHEIRDNAVERDTVIVATFRKVQEGRAGHRHLGGVEGGGDIADVGVECDFDVVHETWIVVVWGKTLSLK